jgi:hypothetical protein
MHLRSISGAGPPLLDILATDELATTLEGNSINLVQEETLPLK